MRHITSLMLLLKYLFCTRAARRVLYDKDEVIVKICDGVEADSPELPLVSERAAEFEKLTHDQNAPCLPEGKSGEWSCAKRYTAAEYETRPKDGSLYGFATKAEAGHRNVGEWVDKGYTRHIPSIPRLTTGRGYLKMAFTDKMKEILNPWYADSKKGGPKDAVELHPPIPGGYTNSKVRLHPGSQRD
jgi:hypothetical protein